MGTLATKTFTIHVGIEYPPVDGDDVFEISFEMYEDEIQAIIEGGKKDLWKFNDLSSSEFMEVFAPSAYKRACKVAEDFAVPEWGEKMLVVNGAKYDFFLPEEIECAIYESDECKKVQELSEKIREISRVRFHEDGNLLKSEQKKGRWGDRLIGDPHWNNNLFGGLWSSGDRKVSDYYIHTHMMLFGKTIEIDNSQNYYYDNVVLVLRLSPTITILQEIIENIVNENGYKITEIRPLGNPVHYWVLYAEGKKTESDIQVYMKVLDALAKLTDSDT